MPRSPSRDLSDRYLGKRGYFRTPDGIRRGKYLLAALAFAAVCVWVAVDIFNPSRVAYGHTHGPLANPHAAFDDNCAACHVAHSVKDLGPISILKARDRWHDFSCEKCHSGPAHHASATAEAQAIHNRCSHCHHDHLGRDSSLVRLADKDCTQCHANLGKWHDAAKSQARKPFPNAVTSFVTDHPAFRSLDLQAKPRTLKFSHAVHMNPGQTYSPGGKEAMTLTRMRDLSGPDAAERYRKPGQANDAAVTLDCASCHKLDSGTGTAEFNQLKTALSKFAEPTKSLLPPRQAGAYFLPINFEEHCRACHPLTAPTGATAFGDKKLVLPGFSVAHRKQPADLLGDLTAGYMKGMSAEKHPALAERPEPGGKLDTPPIANARTLGAEADRLALAAQRQLFSADAGCAKCHTTSGRGARGEPGGGSPPETGEGAKISITPVPDRTVWLTHAKFNHASHRGVTCASCHPGTAGATISPVEANKPEPVQILDVESCRACHSPAGTKVTLPDGTKTEGGGIRHNCTDCHNYHHGDVPFQGRGSELRFPKNPRDLAEWLKGK